MNNCILIVGGFPSLQSTHLTFHGDDDVSIMDNEILNTFDEDEDLRDNVNGFNDLFNEWDDALLPQDLDDRRSQPGSPDMGEAMAMHMSSGLPSSNGGCQKPQQQDMEEVSKAMRVTCN